MFSHYSGQSPYSDCQAWQQAPWHTEPSQGSPLIISVCVHMLTCHLLMDRWEDSFQELIFSFHHRFQGSATGHQTLTASIFYLLYLLASPLLGFCIMSAMKSNHWVFAYMYISTLHVCRACRNEKKASDSLKLGLQTFMNCRCGCWKPNPSSLFERATTSFTPPSHLSSSTLGFCRYCNCCLLKQDLT